MSSAILGGIRDPLWERMHGPVGRIRPKLEKGYWTRSLPSVPINALVPFPSERPLVPIRSGSGLGQGYRRPRMPRRQGYIEDHVGGPGGYREIRCPCSRGRRGSGGCDAPNCICQDDRERPMIYVDRRQMNIIVRDPDPLRGISPDIFDPPYLPRIPHPGREFDRHPEGFDRHTGGAAYHNQGNRIHGIRPGPRHPRGPWRADDWELVGRAEGGQADGHIYRHRRTGEMENRRRAIFWEDSPIAGMPLEAYILEHMARLDISTIVEYRDYIDRGPGRDPMIHYGYEEGGDLQQYLERKGNDPIHPALVWEVFISIAEALAMLHSGVDRDRRNLARRRWERAVHRNVNPSHIFFDSRPPMEYTAHNLPRVCLGGFEYVTLEHESTEGPQNQFNVTPESPRRVAKSDIYSLGFVIYRMMSRERLAGRVLEEGPGNAWREHIDLDHLDITIDTRRYGPDLAHCMRRCLAVDIGNRVDSDILLEDLVDRFEEMRRRDGDFHD